mgnify:FL=1
MNPHTNTSESQTTIPYGYALRMFLGWSILYMGTFIGFIELLRRNII